MDAGIPGYRMTHDWLDRSVFRNWRCGRCGCEIVVEQQDTRRDSVAYNLRCRIGHWIGEVEVTSEEHVVAAIEAGWTLAEHLAAEVNAFLNEAAPIRLVERYIP